MRGCTSSSTCRATRSDSGGTVGAAGADGRRGIALAILLQKQHHLAEAEQLYAGVLDVVPQHPDALHYSGLLAHQQGRTADAVDLMCPEEALDTPLSPPPRRRTGACYPALRCLPGRDFHPLVQSNFQDATF
jgi:hypothetical protein